LQLGSNLDRHCDRSEAIHRNVSPSTAPASPNGSLIAASLRSSRRRFYPNAARSTRGQENAARAVIVELSRISRASRKVRGCEARGEEKARDRVMDRPGNSAEAERAVRAKLPGAAWRGAICF
jgi:hypothetical protein